MKEQTLVPLQTVVVHRNGKSVRPEIGKPFKFTEDEIADVRKVEKEHNMVILRSPVNEAGNDAKAQAIRERAEKTLADLVAKSKKADDAAKDKKEDSKEAKAAADAKDAVRKHCDATGLEVPAGFEAPEL